MLKVAVFNKLFKGIIISIMHSGSFKIVAYFPICYMALKSVNFILIY